MHCVARNFSYLLSTQGYDYNREKNVEKAQKVGKAVLICNIVVVIMNIVFYILMGIITIILVSLAATGRLYGSYYYNRYRNGYYY